jgi:c-di-GMP-binding flagellar brake protein YcgR
MTQHVNFMVGSTVFLSSSNTEDSCVYEARVIGYADKQSLMITLPKQHNTPLLVTAGDKFVARYVGDENAYAFETEVMQICDKPFGYIHLSYPEGVQGVMLRRSQRVDLNKEEQPSIRLSMHDGSGSISVSMADISLAGARLTSGQRLGCIDDKFSIDMHLGQSDKPVSLPCVIRYVRTEISEGDAGVYHHGVEFEAMDAQAQTFINRFITDHVQQQRSA